METAGLLAAAGAIGQGHRLGRRGGLIQQRGIGDRQAGELADQGLEIQQGFQTALGNLRLIGGVGGVPSRVFQHVALDQRWGGGVVVTEADQVAKHRVGGCALLQLPQGLALIALLRQGIARLIGVDQDFGRNALLQQLLEVAAAQALQHLGLLRRRRPEMALNKPSAQEPPSTLAL